MLEFALRACGQNLCINFTLWILGLPSQGAWLNIHKAIKKWESFSARDATIAVFWPINFKKFGHLISILADTDLFY